MQNEDSTIVINNRPNTDIYAVHQANPALFFSAFISAYPAAAIAARRHNMVQGSIKLMHGMRKRGDSTGFSSYRHYEPDVLDVVDTCKSYKEMALAPINAEEVLQLLHRPFNEKGWTCMVLCRGRGMDSCAIPR